MGLQNSITFDQGWPLVMQCMGGMLGGNQIGKLFFEKTKMNFWNALWMGSMTYSSFRTIQNFAPKTQHPYFHTSLEVGALTITAFNLFNGYMGHPNPSDKSLFNKVSIKVWDYSSKVNGLVWVFGSIANKSPAKILSIAASTAITVLNHKKMLPERVSEFWKSAFGDTWLGWGVWIAGTWDNLSSNP